MSYNEALDNNSQHRYSPEKFSDLREVGNQSIRERFKARFLKTFEVEDVGRSVSLSVNCAVTTLVIGPGSVGEHGEDFIRLELVI